MPKESTLVLDPECERHVYHMGDGHCTCKRPRKKKEKKPEVDEAYQKFLNSKAIVDSSTGIDSGFVVSDPLFEFQKCCVNWAVRRGRAALFEGTGLGKSPQQIDWSRIIRDATGKPVLIVAPLAVAHQTINEAEKILGVKVVFANDQSEVTEVGIYITNYQKLDKFDPNEFGGVVLDESSILKSLDGRTKQKLIEDWTIVPFRLCCTATPAPNDYMELGNHAEFLGVMKATEMLSTFFVHDGGETQKWRLKGHAEKDFWRWMASWAICISHPRDLGFEQDGYDLPELRMHEVIVDCESKPLDGELFAMPARSLSERREVRRDTIEDRLKIAHDLIANDIETQWVVWCGLNSEQDGMEKQLTQTFKTITGEGLVLQCASIQGSTSDDDKVKLEREWRIDQLYKDLITKASVFGYGLNWQHCHKMAFIGLSDSFEQLYQAIRRCYRFGQKEPVDVYIIISSLEGEVLKNIKRKEAEALHMQKMMTECMADFTREQIGSAQRVQVSYKEDVSKGENWEARLGDCVDHAKSLADNSVGYSVYSVPFSSLYCYSASDRDMGNCKGDDEFFAHMDFLIQNLYRVTQDGRLTSFHCMNLPTSKTHHGYIGIRDFRGDMIRAFEKRGWIFHSEVVIWKDPLVAMQRTKAIGLLHNQLVKDSAISRQGIPDYVVTMRKPGENKHPIKHGHGLDEYAGDDRIEDNKTENASTNKRSHTIWQKYASPVWMDINPSNTLQFRSAREHADEKHICPLQLDVIERCLTLWSNPCDLVLSPFMGIGSEGYQSIKMGRKFIGFELKESYYKQAVGNLNMAETEIKQSRLL